VLTMYPHITYPHDEMTGGDLSTPMWITFFDFVIMSGGRCMGDNPRPLHCVFTSIPTYLHFLPQI
jgi:hypothetical protein